MKIRFGIMIKLFVWYFAMVFIFYATILVLFVDIRQIVSISENLVNKNYKISSASKKMIESLLWMEESQNKYDLLKKQDYKQYFISAQREFERNLEEILVLRTREGTAEDPWDRLYQHYRAQLPQSGEGLDEEEPSKVLWIPEAILNDWVQRISKARASNELAIESEMRTLTDRGRMAVRWGFLGLGFSVLLGLMGGIFLTHSMVRPLRELRKGIRDISHEGLREPIGITSKDEFGELAGAFNEMAVRLKEEERMRSDFVSMLSHEIRTPLTSIRESVNLIVEEVMGEINDRQRRFLQIASSEIERISDLLNHLLQVSRLEAGGLRIHPVPISPSHFVTGSIDRLAPAAEAKGILVSPQMAPNLPRVMADAEHLQQVMLNLIGNAIKFSPAGTEILVRVDRDFAEGSDRVRFSVSDAGPGIPEKELSMVFHKYYRASGVRKQMDGVGLGLSISKHIVEAHGGSIWVESQVGRGSTFGFTLPAVSEE
ncbi:MAG TPA: HAMP domain-containing sensor histidine kinase [Syntrophobacteraceae bacterium]|nr:HAMP domain-containing sensor histidine kinase [Syntrophobacteraceae bacterium]